MRIQHHLPDILPHVSSPAPRLIALAARLVPMAALRAAGRGLYRTRAGQQVLRRLYSLMAGQSHRISRGPLAGLRIATGGANAGYALGIKEPHVQSELARLLRPKMVVYDIGANIGFFTLQAARLVGPGGCVVAFEPFAPNLAPLRHNVALNGLTNVEVRAVAVGALDGDSVMAEAPEAIGGSTARLASVGATGGQPVSVRALDSLVAAGEIAPPSLIKIDVEGAEVEVLAGMRALLTSCHPVILCEIHDTPEDDWRYELIHKILLGAGYTVRWLEDECDGGMPHIVGTYTALAASTTEG